MVLKLLVLRRSMSYDSPVAEHKVRTGVVKCLIYKEILLLNAEVHLDGADIFIKKIDNLRCRLTQCMQ